MRPPAEDLDRRRKAWLALSDLFLDTELGELERDGLARVLAALGYTPEELRAILRDEVYPVCAPNLLAVTGNWSGFDLDWLEPRILRRRPPTWHLPGWMLPGWRAISAEFDDLIARMSRPAVTPPPSSPS